MWFGERLEINIPNISLDLLKQSPVKELTFFDYGHAGDEYGNCSVYLSTPLIRIVVFPGLCFQREVEVPNEDVHPWFQAMYGDDWTKLHNWIREYTGRYYWNI